MKKTCPHLLVACLLLTAMQCCKTDPKPNNPIDQLPPATQTGENTFGCLVNGEAFVVTNTSKMSAVYQGGGVQISGTLDNDVFDQNILIVLIDPLEEDELYDLTNFNMHRAQVRTGTDMAVCWYNFEDAYQGLFSFSNIDRTNFIISGTFEFSTVTNDCDTIRITDGRFDMQYIP